MVTFNKTELGWIRDAIENDVASMEQLLLDRPDLPPQLITLRKENLTSVLGKLNTIINSNAKRVAIR